MKFAALVVLTVSLVVMTTAFPAKGNNNQQKKKNTPAPKCIEICTTNYAPICAHDAPESGGVPLSFGSECVMRKYNCESNKKYAKQSEGECPGSTGIRLA